MSEEQQPKQEIKHGYVPQMAKKEVATFRDRFRDRTIDYIMAAFALVAGLAWNDAIRALINHIFPGERDTVLAKFTYAFVLTLVLVLITLYLVKLLRRGEEK